MSASARRKIIEMHEEITKLREQLAAQAAVIESLKEALHYSLGAWEYDGVSDEHGSIFREANNRCDTPTDSTQILDEVRRVEREKCAKVCDENHWDDHRLFAEKIRAME